MKPSVLPTHGLRLTLTAILCICITPTFAALRAAETTATVYPLITPEATTRTLQKPYGTVLVFPLENAPYPDDSRTTGFARSKVAYAEHYDDPSVVVVVPPSVTTGGPLDAVIHFHGHGNTPLNALEKHQLGTQLAASGKRAILILPQGPKNASDSGIGKLETTGGLHRLMDETMAALNQVGPLAAQRPTLRNLVVSGHSGGYRPIAMCLDLGGLEDAIKEYWLFDAAYAYWPSYAAGATGKFSNRRMKSLYTTHLANANTTIVQHLRAAGATPTLIRDADFTTGPLLLAATTTATATIAPQAGLRPAEDFDKLLASERILIFPTVMAHTPLIYQREYFRRFIAACPALENAAPKK